MNKRHEEKILNLVHLMKSRKVDQDTCVGVVLKLKTEERLLRMHDWITKNPHAGQTEIMRHLYGDILDMRPYYIIPKVQPAGAFGSASE